MLTVYNSQRLLIAYINKGREDLYDSEIVSF